MCGFAGSWLAEELLAAGYRVRGAALPDESDDNIAHLGRRLTVDRFDILDAAACRTHLRRARPDLVFHLAAIASVGQSFSLGDLTFRVNIGGTQNVFDALRDLPGLSRVLLVSSSDVYGHVTPADLPLNPRHGIAPLSPYAQSKTAAEYVARTYHEQYRLPVVIVRSFNHTGPRQNQNFVIPSFCRKIVVAEASRGRKAVAVGNLDVRRDLSDVRDIVRGYRLLAEKGRPGQTYHLCSGRAHRIGDLLNELISHTDMPIHVKRDTKLFRKADIMVLRGSYHTTKKDTGWKPNIDIATTLAETFDFWRTRLT